MTPENSKKLWKIIQETGDQMQGLLPDQPNHPKSRNSYSHLSICIKDKFIASYKDIHDEKFDEVINFIEFLKNNPN